MYVTLIAHYLGSRLGVGQYIERIIPPLVQELQTQGIETMILGSPNAVENSPALQKLENVVRVLPPLDYPPSQRYLWFATRFTRYCNQEKIHAVVWLSNPIVLPWHPPSLVVIHDVNEWKIPTKYSNHFRTFLRAMIYLDSSFLFARKIIAISQATKKDILSFRPNLTKNKLKTIVSSSDSELVNLPSIPIHAPTEPFLLSVGRIHPFAKRLPDAVALVAALRELSDQSWELHLVGGLDSSCTAAGETFLNSIENVPWVSYHGYVEDHALAEWYRRATAVVFLSDHEGFGFPVAEASSFGRWVIVSQANQAIIEAGSELLIWVNPDDPKAAASTVLHKLEEMPPSVTNNQQSWASTAKAYVQEISLLL